MYDAVEDVSLLQNGGQHWPTLSLCITTEQGNSLQLHVETRQLPVVAHKHQAHDGSEELEPCSVPLADELGKVGCCNPFSTAQLYSPECPGSLSAGERQDTMFSSSSKRLTWQIQHRKIWLAWMQARKHGCWGLPQNLGRTSAAILDITRVDGVPRDHVALATQKFQSDASSALQERNGTDLVFQGLIGVGAPLAVDSLGQVSEYGDKLVGDWKGLGICDHLCRRICALDPRFSTCRCSLSTWSHRQARTLTQ